jgi:glycosidase
MLKQNLILLPFLYYFEQDLDWTSSSATDRLQSDMEDSHLYFGGRLFLNWSHPIVRRKMLEVFEFWVDYVDGFYLKHLDHLQIDSEAALHDILEELRNLLNTKLTHEGTPTRKILICSSNFAHKRHKLLFNHMRNPLESNDHRMSTTANNASKVVDIYTYFDLIDFQLNIDINKTETIRDQVNAIFLNAPKSFPWIHWSVGNVATSRLSTRIGSEYSVTAVFLLIMLPGTISLFYGDEIGIRDTFDPLSHKVILV